MDINAEFRSLGNWIEVTGFSPSKSSLLTTLFSDPLAESRQKSANYLISRIPELQQYSIAKDTEAVILWGQDLKNFGEQQTSPEIDLLANMLIRESSSNHWDVVEALIQQLLQEVEEKLSK